MATCPACQQENKPFFAPVCNECNHRIPFRVQLVSELIMIVLPTGLLVLTFWLLANFL